jgi:hypothetical protein
MAVVVVAGSGRGVGKTALVCGLIAALPEFRWAAVKISAHAHGRRESVWEEEQAGQGTDTGRYLAAGARRAFLVTADELDLAKRLDEIWNVLGRDCNVIFESNRVLRHVQPDLCLAIESDSAGGQKSSFHLVEHQRHVAVRRAAPDSDGKISDGKISALPGAQAVFHLARFEQIAASIEQWLREHLQSQACGRIRA